jgi:hypothetical protein
MTPPRGAAAGAGTPDLFADQGADDA